MHKLLIADSNEDFRLALAESLQRHFQVLSCATGTQALELLRTEKPQLFVLDLMLPELDGVTLLETAVAENIHCTAVVASIMVNDYVCGCMDRLNIRYMVRKPCSICALTTRILDLSRDAQLLSPPDHSLQISRILLNLSMKLKHDGCRYTLCAVPMILENPGIAITKELYPAIAKQYGCKPGDVERSIRKSIEYGWNHGDPDVWQQYFPGAGKRPSNSVFLFRIAEELRRNGE